MRCMLLFSCTMTSMPTANNRIYYSNNLIYLFLNYTKILYESTERCLIVLLFFCVISFMSKRVFCGEWGLDANATSTLKSGTTGDCSLV